MGLIISNEIQDRIKKIDFFSNCGKMLKIKTSYNIKYVKSWKESKTFYSDQNWENTTLEAGNELTSFLSKGHPDQYNQKWNEMVRLAKATVINDILPKIEEYAKINSLDKGFINCVKWDILGAVLEDIYKEYKKEPIMFLKLLEIYESGNFPCGWIGTWPEGSLVVY